jgi:hypothetical protein
MPETSESSLTPAAPELIASTATAKPKKSVYQNPGLPDE